MACMAEFRHLKEENQTQQVQGEFIHIYNMLPLSHL